MNKNLFNKINEVYKNKNSFNLSVEENTLLERKYNSFIRNGALLNEKDALRLCEINLELAKLILSFEENLLAEKKAYVLHITDEKDLKGLHAIDKDAAKQAATSKNLEGWVFTFDATSYIPFMTYIENRALRKIFCKSYNSRCYNNNEYDNQTIVLQITRLRKEKANLLQFDYHSEFVLQDRMAGNSKRVFDFLTEIREKAKTKADEEIIELTKLAKELDGIEILEKWDMAYYSEKLRKKLFDLDQEELKSYFLLENVLKGVFHLASNLYSISFTEVKNMSKQHEDVSSFEVKDEHNQTIAYFFCDFYPRQEKQNGGWEYTFKPQYIDENQVNHRPHVSINCNFPKPTETHKSLLMFEDVKTLFHEFGHALHSMFSNVSFPSLSGINVLWDFVELPSQIMENFCYEPDVLQTFAFHYQTNEVIPMEKIQKIKNAKNFNTGLNTIRQVNFSNLDMKWHSDRFPRKKHQIKQFEKDNVLEFCPPIEESCLIVSFLHLFNSTYDYSAGYYSYHWAEVLDADAFEVFQEKGILNKEVAASFKSNILMKGGMENPMDLFKRFRGKEPSIHAFLKRKGLI